MKAIIFLLFCAAVVTNVCAQDFDKNMATARSSYAAGNLEGARFAMEQLLSDLDAAIGG